MQLSSALARRQFMARFCVSISLLAGATQSVAAEQALAVTTSFSILGDWVQIVGGNRVAVTTLVGADQDAHVFEPKPTDAKAIQKSQLLVLNGIGFEPWAQKLAKAANFKGTTLVASKGVQAMQTDHGKGGSHQHHESDPHAWQNPRNVVIYINNIASALSTLDPAGANTYQNNAQAYNKELEILDNWAQTQFANIAPEKRKVITSHDAFGYFAQRYSIRFMTAQGTSTAAEPSAKQIARLVQQIKREKIKTVFVENMSNPKLMEQLSKDAGATVGASLYADALSSEPQGASYLQMMRHNIKQMAASMQ